jgi:ribonuclease HI
MVPAAEIRVPEDGEHCSSGMERRKQLSGGEPDTTNNRMEMRAIIEGLKALNKPCHVKCTVTAH